MEFQSRRSLLRAGMGAGTLGILGAGGLTGASRPALAQAKTRLRFIWWGSKERSDRSYKAMGLYTAANPNVQVDGESLGWGDYWPKLATQVVGRNAPDLIQMDYRYLFEYARRDTLLAVDPYIPKTLAITDFGKDATDVGRVNGKLYGVNFGANSTAMLYSRTVLEAAGQPLPTPDTTWDDIAKLGEAITKKSGRQNYYGLGDGGAREPLLEVFLRQRGKALYKPDETLGFDASDMEEWLSMWAALRKSGACVPAEIGALNKDTIETAALSLGRAAIDFAHSNQLVGYQQVNPDKLGISLNPKGTGANNKPGQYLKPSMFLSIYARSPQAEEAVKLMNFLVTDPEAGKALGVERGVSVSARQRAAIVEGLNELDKAQVSYIELVSEAAGPIPAPPPKGAGEIAFNLRRTNEQVAFGRMTPRVAAEQFVADAKDILSRS
ncbi:ABC transporter substrate-binding protein [Roseomonas elaeocarpi]|uniref:ABC transporter substrate-binding protein n=1 Tax=Roseomonas elaeocarpi TaxID=907779 RepID=A0ABV6JWT3_9PROT